MRCKSRPTKFLIYRIYVLGYYSILLKVHGGTTLLLHHNLVPSFLYLRYDGPSHLPVEDFISTPSRMLCSIDCMKGCRSEGISQRCAISSYAWTTASSEEHFLVARKAQMTNHLSMVNPLMLSSLAWYMAFNTPSRRCSLH
jgi:hypothetical protein